MLRLMLWTRFPYMEGPCLIGEIAEDIAGLCPPGGVVVPLLPVLLVGPHDQQERQDDSVGVVGTPRVEDTPSLMLRCPIS
eukprot:12908780-Prorocentrum_lima.AAC.1